MGNSDAKAWGRGSWARVKPSPKAGLNADEVRVAVATWQSSAASMGTRHRAEGCRPVCAEKPKPEGWRVGAG